MNNIICLGIATVDAIAKPIDTPPAPKELVIFETLQITTGGCALNCAIDLAKIGITPSLIVKLGTDMLGDFVIKEVQKYGINTEKCIQSSNTNTPFTFVAVNSEGERSFYHIMGTNATLTATEIDTNFISKHKFCYIGGVMVMSTLDKELKNLLKDIKSHDTKTIIDTVYVNTDTQTWQETIYPFLPYTDFFVPSEPEAQAITGKTDPKEIAKNLKSKGGKNIVVKLGQKGVYYLTEGNTSGYVPAYYVENVVDTTGAGDAWDAGFLAGLHLGYDIESACKLGNATAAFCIQFPGASTGVESLEKIKNFQKNNP